MRLGPAGYPLWIIRITSARSPPGRRLSSDRGCVVSVSHRYLFPFLLFLNKPIICISASRGWSTSRPGSIVPAILLHLSYCIRHFASDTNMKCLSVLCSTIKDVSGTPFGSKSGNFFQDFFHGFLTFGLPGRCPLLPHDQPRHGKTPSSVTIVKSSYVFSLPSWSVIVTTPSTVLKYRSPLSMT